MALHGLKVEKLVNGSWDEKQGMIDYYAEFNAQYDTYIDDTSKKSDEQGLVDAVFIKLIMDGRYRVTYSSEIDGSNPQQVVVTNGKLDPPIMALRDQVSKKKLHMVVPSQKPADNEQYVTNILTNIAALGAGDKEKYLLGTILIRKCR